MNVKLSQISRDFVNVRYQNMKEKCDVKFYIYRSKRQQLCHKRMAHLQCIYLCLDCQVVELFETFNCFQKKNDNNNLKNFKGDLSPEETLNSKF